MFRGLSNMAGSFSVVSFDVGLLTLEPPIKNKGSIDLMSKFGKAMMFRYTHWYTRYSLATTDVRECRDAQLMLRSSDLTTDVQLMSRFSRSARTLKWCSTDVEVLLIWPLMFSWCRDFTDVASDVEVMSRFYRSDANAETSRHSDVQLMSRFYRSTKWCSVDVETLPIWKWALLTWCTWLLVTSGDLGGLGLDDLRSWP